MNVSAGQSKVLTVNGMFVSSTSALRENPYFPIAGSINNTVTGNSSVNVTAAMIITPGAYLETGIENTDPYTVYLTPGNFTLISYVKDVVDAADGINNTAYNISFNWTLPTQLSSRVLNGNLTNNYTILNNTNKQYNNLTIGLTSANLGTLNQTTLTVYTYAYGYENSTGNLSLISHVGNTTAVSDSSSVSFLCYTTIDGVEVTACGTLDPDNPAATSTTTTTVSGSGSSGGGGTGSGGGVALKIDYTIVRGKEDSIVVAYTNNYVNATLTNLEFSVLGDLEKYINVEPKEWKTLEYLDSIKVTLKILSPSYLKIGKQEIILQIKGNLNGKDYLEKRRIVLQVVELSEEDTVALLDEINALMDKLKDVNLSSSKLNELQNAAKKAYEELHYEIVQDNHAVVLREVGFALDSLKILNELKALQKEATAKGIDTKGSIRLAKLAQLSLSRGDFEEAYLRAKEAQVSYALEVKGEIGKLSYYLRNNTKEIVLGFFFLIIFAFASYKVGRYEMLKNRIKKLKEEENIITQLIKLAQEETFTKKRMEMDEYHLTIEHYEKKMAGLVESLIDAENQKEYVLTLMKKGNQLKMERARLFELIKELQYGYLKKGNIEGKVYELKMSSYNKRIGEIDSGIAQDEATRALRKGKGIKGFFLSLKSLNKPNKI